jgi:hypothetical protein
LQSTRGSESAKRWMRSYRPRQSNLRRHRAWAPHHLRGLFSSIAPHVAAAVIPPSAISTKTSSGVPKVIILAILVVLATSAVCAARWRRAM